MNPFFTASGAPGTKASGSSAAIRAEFANIKLGFDKLFAFAGNAGKVARVNPGETAFDGIALDAGKYIPTSTVISGDPGAAVFFKFRWMLVGTIFRAEGYFTSPTGVGGQVFTIPLPITTSFVESTDCLGKIFRWGSNPVRLQGDVTGVVGTNKAQFYVEASSVTASNPYRFELGGEVM